MVMPMCSGGEHDMFEPSEWNLPTYIEGCQKAYNVTPRPNWAVMQYGGRDLSSATNIVLRFVGNNSWRLCFSTAFIQMEV